MKNFLNILFLVSLALTAFSQTVIPESYDTSTATPIRVYAGDVVKFDINARIINDQRYSMYLRLQAAAKEKPPFEVSSVLADVSTYMDSQEAALTALKQATDEVGKSADELKGEHFDAMQTAIDNQRATITNLNEKIGELEKSLSIKPRYKARKWPLWAVPVAALAGTLFGLSR